MLQYKFLMIFVTNVAYFICSLTSIALAVEKNYLYTSTVDTVFDIISEDDPSEFKCMVSNGRNLHKVWDKRVDNEPVILAYTFSAKFHDGHTIEVLVNPEFDNEKTAFKEANRYVIALGQLPTSLRRGIDKFSIHKGREAFHAGTGQIVVYSETSTIRIADHHLEESIFHESVHSSWDDKYRQSSGWIKAQDDDGIFLTKYGLDIPHREDLAETALFAYAQFYYPGRIPPVDAKDIEEAIPHRLTFLNALFSKIDDPQLVSPQGLDVCGGLD